MRSTLPGKGTIVTDDRRSIPPLMGSLGGTPYYTSVHAVDNRVERRSWRERLFSTPWRPWVKEKTVTVPAIYEVPSAIGPYYLIHPELERELVERREL